MLKRHERPVAGSRIELASAHHAATPAAGGACKVSNRTGCKASNRSRQPRTSSRCGANSVRRMALVLTVMGLTSRLFAMSAAE
jgi:hypothetical protein